jgi:hypothetical protein
MNEYVRVCTSTCYIFSKLKTLREIFDIKYEICYWIRTEQFVPWAEEYVNVCVWYMGTKIDVITYFRILPYTFPYYPILTYTESYRLIPTHPMLWYESVWAHFLVSYLFIPTQPGGPLSKDTRSYRQMLWYEQVDTIAFDGMNEYP